MKFTFECDLKEIVEAAIACQSKGLEEIEKLNQFFDLINRR